MALNLSICSLWHWLLLVQTLQLWWILPLGRQTRALSPSSRCLCIASNWVFSLSEFLVKFIFHPKVWPIRGSGMLACVCSLAFSVSQTKLILKMYLFFTLFYSLLWSVLRLSFSLFFLFSPAPLKVLHSVPQSSVLQPPVWPAWWPSVVFKAFFVTLPYCVCCVWKSSRISINTRGTSLKTDSQHTNSPLHWSEFPSSLCWWKRCCCSLSHHESQTSFEYFGKRATC